LLDGAIGLTMIALQETLNYWKQLPHVLKYFRIEEDPKAKLPTNFMGGFLEVSES
jgi:NADH dehydrogenase (ubiquinone) 1 alpha subcomplex subunit 6